MYKFWDVYGTRGEYVYLTAAAKCATEDDVREWMVANHPRIAVRNIKEDEGN